MRNRKDERIRTERPVWLRHEDSVIAAVVVNLSAQGLRVRAERDLPIYKEIVVQLDVGDRTIELRGSVRWSNPADPRRKDGERVLGIQILEGSVQYGEYLRYVKENSGK